MTRRPVRERVLAVDDSPDTLDALLQNLSAEGYEARGAPGGEEALHLLGREPFDFVLTDMKMPGMGGTDLVKAIRARYPDIEVMVITGYATIEGAVEAVKTGAEEYLAKPFTLEELFRAVDRLRERRLQRMAGRKPARLRLGLVGESDAMRRAISSLEEVGRQEGPVLLLGESGTGRAAAARALASLRGSGAGPHLALDPAGARALLEAGALGSESERVPIYLPRVDLLGPAALEILESLVSGHALLNASLTLSANPDLPLLAEAGIFPRGLRALLAPRTVVLPPLRERGEDALLLARHLVADLASRAGVGPPELSEGFRRTLLAYTWPGNVEELEAEVTRAFLRRRGETLDSADLSPHMAEIAGEGLVSLARAQEHHIRRVLAAVGGHRGKAAEILGIDRKTLRQRLEPGRPGKP